MLIKDIAKRKWTGTEDAAATAQRPLDVVLATQEEGYGFDYIDNNSIFLQAQKKHLNNSEEVLELLNNVRHMVV